MRQLYYKKIKKNIKYLKIKEKHKCNKTFKFHTKIDIFDQIRF